MPSTSQLAILGGSPAVTISSAEQWKRPVEREKELVCELIEQGAVSGAGAGLPLEFEEEFREFIGCKYCLSIDHGSTALHSALWAAGVGPGDEVIAPTAGYLGSYCGALHLGAIPVFCEIDPKTLLMDPADVEKRITERTRAIIPIHMCGRPCDMDALLGLAEKHNITVVEDAAHAHGSEWDGKKIGNVGHVACFSLQGNDPGGKPVSGGEGGIVCTNDRELYERQLVFCHLHRTGVVEELTLPEHSNLDSQVLGLKWRAHPLALALAKVSLSTLVYRNERRRQNRAMIFDGLREVPGIDPVQDYPKARPAGFYGGWRIIYNPDELDGLPVKRFVEAVQAEGAPVSGPGLGHMEHLRMIYTKGFDIWGDNRHPLNQNFKPHKLGDFPISEGLRERVLRLPAYIEPRDGFLEQYVEAFGKVAENYKELL
ncbi:MAG: DegT/DnrJ/EryC1/StrS family aminotransferase [Armatimonadota bacterium]